MCQKNKEKLTCSKKILIVSYACAILLTLTVIVGSFLDHDMSNVSTIAALAWGEVAVSNAFYYKKAGRENVLKIYHSLPEAEKEKVDISNIFNN